MAGCTRIIRYIGGVNVIRNDSRFAFDVQSLSSKDFTMMEDKTVAIRDVLMSSYRGGAS